MRLCTAVFTLWTICSSAAGQTKDGPQLQYAVIVTRHGVRAPTWTLDRLAQYSAAPWPEWGVPPANLTPHGFALMKIMGGFYRDYFAARKLIASTGCSAVERTSFYADTDQRTLESARALAEGMFPGCKAEIQSHAGGTPDPLFDPVDAGQVKQDPLLARAAVLGSIGPKPEAIVAAHQPAFDMLNFVLLGKGKAKRSIFDEPFSLKSGEPALAMTGPLRLASTFTENLLLEYTNGFKGQQLGWGRLNASNLNQMMVLHTAYADLMRRTPYLARARGDILLQRVVSALQQAASPEAEPGPRNALLILSGHDSNVSNLSGLLGLSWLLPGYQKDDVPPGGALVFSLWRSPGSGYSVRVQFMSQTLEQMHEASPLSLAAPPDIADLFVPACSTADAGYPCGLRAFAAAARPEVARP